MEDAAAKVLARFFAHAAPRQMDAVTYARTLLPDIMRPDLDSEGLWLPQVTVIYSKDAPVLWNAVRNPIGIRHITSCFLLVQYVNSTGVNPQHPAQAPPRRQGRRARRPRMPPLVL
jgi:hypothetical protein